MLPPLSTQANRIVNRATGLPVLLRGINRSGLEYSEPREQGFLTAAGISHSEIALLAGDWRCNIIRLPFNQEFALRGRGRWKGEDYLNAIDQVVEWAAGAGMYTLLALQWLQSDVPHAPERDFVPPLPNLETPHLWSTLARRYRDRPEVLFDLLTEPHDPVEGDPWPLYAAGGRILTKRKGVTQAEWPLWATRLIDEIRVEHPRALIFVSGAEWGYNLEGIDCGRPDVVYSTHVYPGKKKSWNRAFAEKARSMPVFLGEFGGTAGHTRWGMKLLSLAGELQLGWCAWGWPDQPRLIENAQPTVFGDLVRNALLLSNQAQF